MFKQTLTLKNIYCRLITARIYNVVFFSFMKTYNKLCLCVKNKKLFVFYIYSYANSVCRVM